MYKECMKAVLVFIDGTICDRSVQVHLIEAPEFFEREAILGGLPVPGSAGRNCWKPTSVCGVLRRLEMFSTAWSHNYLRMCWESMCICRR